MTSRVKARQERVLLECVARSRTTGRTENIAVFNGGAIQGRARWWADKQSPDRQAEGKWW